MFLTPLVFRSINVIIIYLTYCLNINCFAKKQLIIIIIWWELLEWSECL